jgi:tRNA(Ile)-lysidine synthase TilS/MesJ
MSQTPLYSKLQRLFFRACEEFQLVEPGDRILIGLSGGKDSLTTVNFLGQLRDSQPGKFEVLCAHIKFTNLPYAVDLDYLNEFTSARRVQFILVEDHIRPAHMESGMTCVHCSRYRRAKLMNLCREHQCNKLVLGHHLDDIVATLVMSMAQHGRFGGMAVKLPVTVGETKHQLTFIRPLCCIAENEIRAFVAEQGYKPEKCRCPWGDVGLRSKARDVVDFLCEGREEVRMNLFRAQFNIAKRYLANIVTEEEEDTFDIEDLSAGVPR